MPISRPLSLAIVLLALFLAYIRRQAQAVTALSDAVVLAPASRSGLPGWMDLHEKHLADKAKATQGLDVLIYGDSIMEAFRGTSMGFDFGEMFQKNKDAYTELLGSKKSLVMAISGDQISHLLWRLRNGEGPSGLNPRIITVMIGTNDVAHLSSVFQDDNERIAQTISAGVQQCVREVQQQAPQATIVLFGLLPLQPVMHERMFDSKVEAVNTALQAFVEKEASDKIRFKDCSADFLDANGLLKAELMPDGIHPSGDGGAVLLKCMVQAMWLS